MHDIMIGALVLIAVLLAMTSNYWLQHVSHLSYLFKDNITLGLIATVVVLLTLYDCKLGVAFAFVVAVVAINLQQEGFESFADTKKKDKPHRPIITRVNTQVETFQNMAPEQGAAVITDKIEKQMQLPVTSKCNASAKDFNTYSAGKDYHGYDVAGCRYDLENKTQNGTMYGPPLSWCATYGNTGLPVPFYPLNG